MSPIIYGMLRVKNEARWIDEVLQSIFPICQKVFVLDDHSTDGTPELCEWVDDRITVYRSTFEGLNESRDKNFLLERITEHVPSEYLGVEQSPYWALAVDGDEVLHPDGKAVIVEFCRTTALHVAKLPIWYLWNGRDQRRVDGVYRNFVRPSLFQINRRFTFMTTICGANGENLHCSSAPQEIMYDAVQCEAPLLHLGYMDRADRVRKYEWYNKIDPNNERYEDCYRHVVIGDLFPVESVFRFAGPLQLRHVPETLK